ncbi:uncharacterized protein B0H18DRAFT_521913 [Fomitopsis serialis]|uniref:uncharacterized protein n=1 Tax=Fomitopsis serialis TaxID=139415 RepID=UPI0020089409|nr:uncharacterized protein B0H18DRAFT_521913 [Neoantrodia serialis]KAH9922187.1 hypothetical protein B0H18DRAFT_521913 [Neoantrodia serialis]
MSRACETIVLCKEVTSASTSARLSSFNSVSARNSQAFQGNVLLRLSVLITAVPSLATIPAETPPSSSGLTCTLPIFALSSAFISSISLSPCSRLFCLFSSSRRTGVPSL